MGVMLQESSALQVSVGAPAASLIAAAREYGTPVYVTHLETLARDAAELERPFAPAWRLCYSLKANHLPALVERLASRGWGANVVSAGEWRLARRAGVANANITFEGIGKSDDELAAVVAAAATGEPLRWTSLESADEAGALLELARSAGLGAHDRPPVDVLLRLNPAVNPQTHDGLAVGRRDSKFGMTGSEIRELLVSELFAHRAVRVRGLHVHVGSQLGAVDAWVDGIVQTCALLGRLDPSGTRLDTLDAGGGFPVGAGQPEPPAFVEALDVALRDRGLTLPSRIAIEPGRRVVASAGWLVARVLHARERGAARQVVIDAGMTELVRPALYGARHPAYALSTADPSSGELVPTRLEGPVCESVDHHGTYQLPRLRRGDLVAIAHAGAYTSSLSSHYNGRDRAPEVLIEQDGRLTLARQREQAG